MNNGFIKLYRCIEDSFFWNDSEAVHLWIQLLLSVNHKEKEMLLSGEKVIIKGGQFVCSRNTLSQKTGINESKVQRVLKLFENEQMIEQQTNSKYRVITILNWSKYQIDEQVSEQQMNSKRTADEQQMNTNKNDKNDKNDKNKEKDTIVSKKKFGDSGKILLKDEEYEKLVATFGETATKDKIQNLENYILSKGKKYASHYHTILNWERKNEPKKEVDFSNLFGENK